MLNRHQKRKFYQRYHGLVIAGTVNQYNHWLRENKQSKADWKYINKEEDAWGYYNLPIILVGTAETSKPKLIKVVAYYTQWAK